MNIESDSRPKILFEADKDKGGSFSHGVDSDTGDTLELRTLGIAGKPVTITLKKVEDGLNEIIDVRPVDKDTDK